MRAPGRVGSPVAAAVVLALSACAAALMACGSDERSFDAESVVAALNDADAGLVLGEPLPPSTVSDLEVTVIELESGGSGAVVIVEDAESARAEFERCESAVSFICFRAGNAVLRFDGLSPAEQQRLSVAVASLERE